MYDAGCSASARCALTPRAGANSTTRSFWPNSSWLNSFQVSFKPPGRSMRLPKRARSQCPATLATGSSPCGMTDLSDVALSFPRGMRQFTPLPNFWAPQPRARCTSLRHSLAVSASCTMFLLIACPCAQCTRDNGPATNSFLVSASV